MIRLTPSHSLPMGVLRGADRMPTRLLDIPDAHPAVEIRECQEMGPGVRLGLERRHDIRGDRVRGGQIGERRPPGLSHQPEPNQPASTLFIELSPMALSPAGSKPLGAFVS